MKVKDLQNYIYDKVIVYTEDKNAPEGFIDLHKGDIKKCSQEVLQKNIKGIYARRKDVLEIHV